MLDFDQYEVLTFDCYGTLIDWESGLTAALEPILRSYGITLAREELLERYAELESEIERGPYRDYKSVLMTVLERMAHEFNFSPTREGKIRFSQSVKDWPAFPDSATALRALQSQYRLVILSNIDDDLFAHSAERLHVKFDDVITAEQIKSYKPSPAHFETALDRLGMPKERLLHVAQSLYHDIGPAKELGFNTVWVNRRMDQAGFGATPRADVQPDLEVPDLETLVALIEK